MVFLLAVLILGILFLYGLKEYYQIKTGVIPQKTPEASISYLAKMIERSADSGTLLDLGSSYGSRVLGLAQRLPTWEVSGIEFCPTLWIIGNLRTVGKNFGNYRFFRNDPELWPLKDYSVVFVHQNERTLRKWEPSIANRLQPGTLLISYNRPFPRLKPIDQISINVNATLYLYKRAPRENTDFEEPVLPIDATIAVQTPLPPVVEDIEDIQPQPTLPL